jgi:hypothetical protein
MIRVMATVLQQDIARRLRAVMAELGMNRRQFAEFLETAESKLGNWLGKGPKANKPPEEVMVLLCEKAPGLTLDYLYRGVLDHVPMALAIRLKAWEEGIPQGEGSNHQTPARIR